MAAEHKPAILIMQPHLGFLGPVLEARFTVWRFWEHPPIEAQGTIEALVIAGEFAVDKDLAAALPRLTLIACFTVGYDGVDVAWARRRGLKVTHSPGVNHEDVADHALGLMLSAWRKIAEGDRQLRAGEWTAGAKLLTPSLTGRKVGIVGLGDIGAAVARRCAPFGLAVSWWGPRQKPDAPWPRAASLMELAKESDILVVASRANDANRGLIDAEVIEAVGRQGLIVNVARGQLIDEDALIAALIDGRLGGAALDVYAAEPTSAERWADVPNTVLTPHTAGATSAAVPRMVAMTVETLRRHFAGEELENEVRE
jgi:lactate dehydrogenase-like 2-hydroxyacid dehydrogenase